MRHCRSKRWPWRFALATQSYPCTNSSNRHSSENDSHSHIISRYESRWHGRGGADFGVRRPLRYLSHRLDLDENQTRRMAAVLNRLKTEREQASLDERRSTAALAGLLESGTPTLDETREVLASRVETAEHLKEEVAEAMVAISSFLDDDQRSELISLMQSGSISF